MTTIPILGTGPTVNSATGNSGMSSFMAGAFLLLLRDFNCKATPAAIVGLAAQAQRRAVDRERDIAQTGQGS